MLSLISVPIPQGSIENEFFHVFQEKRLSEVEIVPRTFDSCDLSLVRYRTVIIAFVQKVVNFLTHSFMSMLIGCGLDSRLTLILKSRHFVPALWIAVCCSHLFHLSCRHPAQFWVLPLKQVLSWSPQIRILQSKSFQSCDKKNVETFRFSLFSVRFRVLLICVVKWYL